MFNIEGISVTSPQAAAQAVRNESVQSALANSLEVKQFLASARGAVGAAPEPNAFNPTAFVPAEVTTVTQISIEATATINDQPEIQTLNVSTYATRHPNTPVDLPSASAITLEPRAFVTDQNASVTVPISINYIATPEEQFTITVKEGFGGLKALGRGDVGFQFRNPQTNEVWFSSNDIVWNQVDFFEVAGGSTVSKTYDFLTGWEKLVTQCFMDAPPSTRKMLDCNTTWSGNRLTVSGGSERTLILVFAR